MAAEIYAALGEFVPMAAKVLSPRIRVTRQPAPVGPGDRWLIEDAAHRLF